MYKFTNYDDFSDSMNQQNEAFDCIIADQIFLLENTPQLKVTDSCSVAVVEPLGIELEEEGIQSTSKLSDLEIVETREKHVLPDQQNISSLEEEEYYSCEEEEEYYLASEVIAEPNVFYLLTNSVESTVADGAIWREMYFKASEQNPGKFCSSTEGSETPKTLEDVSANLSVMQSNATTSEKCSNMPETLGNMSDLSRFNFPQSANTVSGKSNDEGSEDLKNIQPIEEVGINNHNVYTEIFYENSEIENSDTWSILTNRLYYLYCRPNQEVIHENPKNEHFNADNSNIPYKNPINISPVEVKCYRTNNKQIAQNQNLDDKYDGETLYIQLEDKFNPDKHISSTYLWTLNSSYLGEPKICRNAATWFPEGSFAINIKGETTGYLLDGTPITVKTLVDSGATKPILNIKYYEKTPFLQSYPVYKIKPRGIRVGNNQVIRLDSCICMMINFGGHVFEITAYLLDMTEQYDFVIGQKTMYELEGGPHFGQLSFHFLMRSIPLLSTEEIVLKPGGKIQYILQMAKIPPDFKEGECVIKIRSSRIDGLAQTLKAKVDNKGRLKITAHNEGKNIWTISEGEKMGSIDMRSMGYFHIDTETILNNVQESIAFLSEGETQEYFHKLVEDLKEINKVNTKLKTREGPTAKDSNKFDSETGDLYPWLDKEDPRRFMTDKEIINKYINLEESYLTEKEKKHLKRIILKYRPAFSLRDEIGLCPHMEVELELTDKTPFFIRPFPIKEGEKDLIDKEMRKGVLLGILKKGMSSYSSPIMLIPRKQGGIPRIVTDFRHLNSRLVTLQPSIPLVRDAIQILGASGCEVISVIDLRDAYHTLRLSKKSQKYCGITPYYGSDTYLYQRLGMGLSVSPAVWQNFIQRVLSEIPDHRKHHLAIMDDCLVHSKKRDHLHHLIDLFKALIRNGLKISPKKCQLFRKRLVYMGHTLLIENGIPEITPLKVRTEAILKLDPPKTPKHCKQFCGMVNFLSIFLKDLQITLTPIYFLTKKGIPFVWTEECQKAFDEIKQALTNPPVLVMPNETGQFVLVSDTSTIGCGATLYQEQKGKYRVVAYYSKKLPDAVKRYSISELELTGMLANITAFKHILRNTEFIVYCDHSALVHIVKAKREPPTLRLQKLIEHLMDYKFIIRFQKGKELHVTDFLSRHPDNDTDSPNEIIPIAFQLVDCFNVMTRSQAAKAQAVVPKMFPLQGDHKKPEESQKGVIKIPDKPPIQQNAEKPEPEEQIIAQNIPEIPKMPMPKPFQLKEGEALPPRIYNLPQNVQSVNFPIHNSRLVQPIPLDVKLVGRLPAYDVEYEDNEHSFAISEHDKNRKLLPLFGKPVQFVRKKLPQQLDLDKFVRQLKTKVIHDYKIPLSMKELKAEYNHSPFFGDIYKYKQKGICRNFGKGNIAFKSMCEDYFIVEGILFKVKYEHTPTAVLCIPEKYIPIVLYQYHDTILAGHPGVQKLLATVSKKYYFPNMMTIIRQYVISCLECQSMKRKQEGKAIYFPRIPLTFRPMSRFSMDIKHMPPSSLGFTKLLVCTCESSNFIVGICLLNEQASTIAEALYNKIVCMFGPPKAIICDEGPAFKSELMLTYFHALNIKPYYVSPTNHGSNRSERYIKTLSEIITKHLCGMGEDWPLYVAPSCFAMNCQVSLITKYSPYEMIYLMEPPDLLNIDFDVDKLDVKIDVDRYMQYMYRKKRMMKQIVLDRKKIEAETQYIREIRRHPDFKPFRMGDLVFLDHSGGSLLHAPSKKFQRNWIGPLKIHQVLDETHYVISDWDDKILSPKVHINRIKKYAMNMGKINEEGKLEVIDNARELYGKWIEILKDKENSK